MNREYHGYFLGILAALAMAVSGTLIRAASTIPFETIIFFRFAISLFFVLPAIGSGRVVVHWNQIPKHFWRAMFGLISIYCYVYSVMHLPLVNALTLANTAPLFMPVVILIWLNLIVPRSRFFAILIGFVGILIILRPGPGFDLWANIIGLVGGIFIALAQVGVRQLSRNESTETILSYYFLISSFVSFFPMIYAWRPIHQLIAWVLLFFIGISSLAYQVLFTRALTHAPVTKVGTANYLSVVFSGLFGWWFFNEVPSLWVLVGVALIIGGGAIAMMSKQGPRSWRNPR